jgi:hypothetical protein
VYITSTLSASTAWPDQSAVSVPAIPNFADASATPSPVTLPEPDDVLMPLPFHDPALRPVAIRPVIVPRGLAPE